MMLDDAGGHNLFGGADCVHFGVGESDLPRVHIVDQFVVVHEIGANNFVV
jgi:hypothetical protein